VNGSASPNGPTSQLAHRREERAPRLLLGVGAVLLLASLFLGWYQIHEVNRSGCTGITETLSPFWVTVTTSGTGCPPSEIGSFQAAGLPQTGALYFVAGVLTAVAGVLALMLILLNRRVRQSRRSSIILIAVSVGALALAALAPVLIVMEQPSAVCHDEGVFQTPLGTPEASSVVSSGIYLNQSAPEPPDPCNGWSFWSGSPPGSTWPVWVGSSGPWDSYAGSNESGSAELVWGPTLGWVLDLGGIALLVAGPVLARKPEPPA
jgi:hypothetical protein